MRQMTNGNRRKTMCIAGRTVTFLILSLVRRRNDRYISAKCRLGGVRYRER